jgi:hypothetical protein
MKLNSLYGNILYWAGKNGKAKIVENGSKK